MNVSSPPVIRRRTAVVSWLTIFIQAAFPLSLTFTPSIAAAQSKENVPATKWYQSANSDPYGQSPFDSNASSLSAAGSALSEGNAAGMARSAASGAVSNTMEEWLSQFGTARVQLNLDDSFKTEGSEADLLVPLYQNDSAMFFTQLGYRHQDERNTGNFGLGARYFAGDWMLGANTFYDNDFTGDNRRMGVGVEAWRDYLKLSANSYIRLSDWHQSRDFADYDERPANGYDLRVEGWLPAYPQLGAKMMYEQYKGDEVALFGKDNRQKDPWAFTGGVTYTPVPLVTLALQQRAGKDGQNDAQINLQMNYRLGESWDKQLDPGQVGASRTLAGTRYDLVERNNTIVLDYRKQETVQLIVPEKSVGKAHSTMPITFSVQSKSPLQRIDWDAAALVAAGGSLTQTSNTQLSATLPPYQPAGSNVYRFAGVAYDSQGNSGSATGEIHVEVGDVQPGASKVSADPTSILADGKSTSVVNFALMDADGNSVPGVKDSLSVSLKESLAAEQPASRLAVQAATISAVAETSPGVYQATVTAGTRLGQIVVSSTFNKIALPDVTIAQTADAATGHIAEGAIKIIADNSVANNSAVNQVQATIADAGNNPLANTKVTFTLGGSAIVAPGSSLTTTTDEQGLAKIGLVNKVAETVTVTATLENGNTGSIDTRFIADSSTATMTDGDISVDKTHVVANNSDVATFTALVKDANGNPVPDFTVGWKTDKGTLANSSSKSDANGKALMTLKHNVSEAAQVTAQAGQSGNINAPIVNFTGDSGNLDAAKSALTATPATIVADGVAASTVILSLKDVNNNPVSGQLVAFVSSLAGTTLTNTVDNGDGTYSAHLSGLKSGAASITVTLGGSAFGVSATTINLSANSGNLDAAKSSLAATPATIVADGTAASNVTLSLRDANDNPVSGQPVTFVSSLAGSTISSVVDNRDGTYSAQLSGSKIGSADITVTVGGSAFGVNAANVTLTADSSKLDAAKSSLTATPATIVADGAAQSTLTLSLKDANDNPVSGQTINFISSLTGSSVGNVTDHGDGTYSAQLSGSKMGQASITTTVGGAAFGVNAASVTLTADSSKLDATKSVLTAAPATIVADGTTASTVTLSLKDVNDNPVSGQAVVFSSTLTGSSLGNVTDHGDGTYSAQLTGLKSGSSAITATVGGAAFGVNAASVTLTADSGNLDTAKSSLSASPATIVADGTTASTVTLSLKDANDNPVSGQTVTFISSLTGSSVGNVTDHGDGTYSAPLTGTKIGQANITTTVAGAAFGVSAATVNLTANSDNLDAAKSALTATPATIVADGTAASTVTLSLKDANDNPVSGQTVTFISSLTGSIVGDVTDHGDGTYSAPLTGSKMGQANITTTVGGAAFGVNAASVTLTADSSKLDATKSVLTAAPATIVADGTTASTVTLSLKDVNDNPVNGQTVQFASSLAGTAVSNVADNGDGTYSAQLTGLKSGSTNITVTVGGAAFAVNAASITLTADSGKLDTTKSALAAVPTTIVADGTAASTVTLSLKDVNDNPVIGQTVQFASSLAGSTVSNVTDNGDGTYSVELTGTKSGSASITVTVGGTTFAVSATTVTLIADSSKLDASKSLLTAAPATIVADGTTASTVTLSLKDVNDNPVIGQTVAFATSLAGSVFTNVVDHNDGTYSAQLTGLKSGSSAITATVSGVAFAVNAASVTLTADSSKLDATKSVLTAAPTTIVANGTAASALALSLKDVNDNPVSGQTVTFISSLTGTTVGSVVDNDDGTYSASLTGIKAGDANITVKVNNTALSVTVVKVTLIADVTTAKISSNDITVDKTFLPADNTQVVTYTALVKDANDNPVGNMNVIWSGNPPTTTFGSSTPTDSAGQTKVTLKGMREQTAIIKAATNGLPAVNAPSVMFKMPELAVTNGSPIQPQQITNALATTEAVYANLYNGHWTDTINFPAASGLSGKSVKIINSATLTTKITINGSSFDTVQGTTYLYKSNGSTWVLQ